MRCMLMSSPFEKRLPPRLCRHIIQWRGMPLEERRMSDRYRFQARLAFVCALVCMASAANAADDPRAYPNKPVRMIVAFAPGGSSDVVARVMAQHLSAMWGQQVVVDNRPGAGGMLGHEIGARAPADGYTIMLTSIGPLAVNPILYRKAGYDPLKSFTPVTLTVSLLNALVVHPSVPATSVKELIAYAKARPGQVNY